MPGEKIVSEFAEIPSRRDSQKPPYVCVPPFVTRRWSVSDPKRDLFAWRNRARKENRNSICLPIKRAIISSYFFDPDTVRVCLLDAIFPLCVTIIFEQQLVGKHPDLHDAIRLNPPLVTSTKNISKTAPMQSNVQRIKGVHKSNDIPMLCFKEVVMLNNQAGFP